MALRPTLDENCGTGLYMLRLPLLDHVVYDSEQFVCLELLDAWTFVRFDVHMKQAYRTTSRRESLCMVETRMLWMPD